MCEAVSLDLEDVMELPPASIDAGGNGADALSGSGSEVAGQAAADAKHSAPALGRMESLQALRAWMWEAPLSSAQGAMTSGTFQTGYALFLGSSSFVLGVLAAIPPLVNVLQLISSYLAHLIGSRRRIVSVASVAGRLIWIPILLIPFVLPRHLWLGAFLILTLISNALMAVSAPVWMDWMSDIVPADKRGRYFGKRNVYGGLTSMVVSVAGGAFLDYAVKQDYWSPQAAFAGLFAVACVFAVGAFFCASASPDIPESARPRPAELSLRDALATYTAPLKDLPYRQVILLSLAVTGIQTFNGNFFTAYQLQYLNYSYSVVQALGLASSITALVAMPLWGYLADKFGNKPVLILSTLMVLPIPIMWCATWPDSYPGLYTFASDGGVVVSGSKMMVILINTISAIGWSGIGMGQFNLVIGSAPREARGAYIAAGTALGGIVGALSPLAGGAIMQALAHTHFPTHGLIRSNFHALFVISAFSRLLILSTAAKITERNSRSARYVLGQLRSGNPVGAAAAIQKLSRSGDSMSRSRAAAELGRLKAPIAVEELVRALDDAALPVREQAAEALGEIGDSRAVRPLLEKLNDPGSGITTGAAEALGKIGDRAALPELIAAARDAGSITARAAAIEALGRLPQGDALNTLIDLAANPAVSLRTAALRALAIRSDLGGNDALSAAVLGQWERETEQPVLPLLAEIVSQLGNPTLAEVLIAGLDRCGSPVARRELLNAVGSLLGGRDSFYAYLRLDRSAADETISKILTSLQRQHRPSRTAPGAGLAARFVVRVRQAMAAYALGDFRLCVVRLDEAAQLAARNASGHNPLQAARLSSAHALRRRSEQAQLEPEELLLMVFLVRLLAGD